MNTGFQSISSTTVVASSLVVGVVRSRRDTFLKKMEKKYCRYNVGNRSASAVATGMLKGLIHAGELPEEKIHLAVDFKKVS